MARDFDNTNDNLLGTDLFPAFQSAATYSFAFWAFPRLTAGTDCFMALASDAATFRALVSTTVISGGTFKLEVSQLFSGGGGLGQWVTTNAITGDVRVHLALTYDGSDVANDPVMYVNGASVAVTENATPVGTMTNSDTDTIKYGERPAGSNDYDGKLQHALATPSILVAGDINRAMWWGRPMGGLNVYMPLVTDKLANEGAQSATFVASGTTVNSLATPAVRPGTAMMGMGIGW